LFLSSDNPEHRERVQLQLMRALNRDAESGNQKAKNILQQLQSKPMNTNLMQARLAAEDTSDFMGIGKKAKQRKQQRADDKTDRKAARNDLIRAKAHAARTYADKGLVVPKTDIAGIAKSVLGAAGNVAGAMTGLNLTQQNLAPETDSVAADTRTITFNPGAQQQPQKNNTMLFVGIAVVVLAIIAVFVFKKKKK
jgi:LPXTG-motif cell wall-anchored protein